MWGSAIVAASGATLRIAEKCDRQRYKRIGVDGLGVGSFVWKHRLDDCRGGLFRLGADGARVLRRTDVAPG